MTEYNSKDIKPINRGKKSDLDTGSGVTILFDEEMKNRFGKQLAEIMKSNTDLWYIQIRKRSGEELMMFRGPHP